MMYHALNGLGQCSGGYDEYGVACADFTPITNDPVATATALQYLNTPTPGGGFAPPLVSGSPSSGFNWGFLGPLIGAAGSTATAAIASGNQTQAIQAQSAAQIAASQASVANTSSLTTMLMLGTAAVVLVMVMTRKGH